MFFSPGQGIAAVVATSSCDGKHNPQPNDEQGTAHQQRPSQQRHYIRNHKFWKWHMWSYGHNTEQQLQHRRAFGAGVLPMGWAYSLAMLMGALNSWCILWMDWYFHKCYVMMPPDRQCTHEREVLAIKEKMTMYTMYC